MQRLGRRSKTRSKTRWRLLACALLSSCVTTSRSAPFPRPETSTRATLSPPADQEPSGPSEGRQAEETQRCGGPLSATVLQRTFAPEKLATFGKAGRKPLIVPYVTQEGDTMASIAHQAGERYALKSYASAENSTFREANPDGAHLRAGTILWLEDGNRAANVRLQDSPPNQKVTVLMEGVKTDVEALTDAESTISVTVPPGLKSLTLLTTDDLGTTCVALRLGRLPSGGTLRGIQARLVNLGFLLEASGRMDEKTHRAIRAFQRIHNLAETGEIDAATSTAIVANHGS